jgi:hypothetical protein
MSCTAQLGGAGYRYDAYFLLVTPHEDQRHRRMVSALVNPLGTMDANAQVSDGVLVGLNLWGASVINLVVECADGKYFGSLRAPRNVYDKVLEFLKQNHGRGNSANSWTPRLTSPT